MAEIVIVSMKLQNRDCSIKVRLLQNSAILLLSFAMGSWNFPKRAKIILLSLFFSFVANFVRIDVVAIDFKPLFVCCYFLLITVQKRLNLLPHDSKAGVCCRCMMTVSSVECTIFCLRYPIIPRRSATPAQSCADILCLGTHLPNVMSLLRR